jgi:hypothetical protein
LKGTSLNNFYRFDKKNLNFWKVFLESPNEEIKRRAKETLNLIVKFFVVKNFIWRKYSLNYYQNLHFEIKLNIEIASDEDIACIKNKNGSYCSDLNKFISKQFIREFLIPLVKIKKLFYKRDSS